jgi:zinc transporter 1/2/3
MYVFLNNALLWSANRNQLFTHAELFFSNDCIEGIEYEATAGAIMIAGLFITFIIEYIAHRWVDRKRHMFERSNATSPATAEPNAQKETSEGTSSESSSSEQNYTPKSLTLNTTVMEAGIIFHSIRQFLMLATDKTLSWQALQWLDWH